MSGGDEVTIAEIRALAKRNGVTIEVAPPEFGKSSQVIAYLGGRSHKAVGDDVDQLVVRAIEGVVWNLAEYVRTSDRLTDCEVGWAFAVFNDSGGFPVASETGGDR